MARGISLIMRGSSGGFTLVELVATLVIIALIAVVSGPLFSNVNVFKQSGFYEETLSSLRYAQKHAVATGCPVRVQTTTTGFTLYRPASAAACTTGPYSTPLTDPSGNAATFARTAPSGVSLAAADFTFSASGAASADQNFNVGGVPIRVFAITGYVGR